MVEDNRMYVGVWITWFFAVYCVAGTLSGVVECRGGYQLCVCAVSLSGVSCRVVEIVAMRRSLFLLGGDRGECDCGLAVSAWDGRCPVLSVGGISVPG